MQYNVIANTFSKSDTSEGEKISFPNIYWIRFQKISYQKSKRWMKKKGKQVEEEEEENTCKA